MGFTPPPLAVTCIQGAPSCCPEAPAQVPAAGLPQGPVASLPSQTGLTCPNSRGEINEVAKVLP